ncbi:ATP-binding protein [Acidocella aminolytica]|uniref:ATP-binding protein n=1 Tax=Acidocella aminolytica TaxID=33998 RepID=UPI0006624909|nr:ATP-binding protein [Acidocella aminolytica]GBQ38253.1 two-component hybrid sensor and regulator [Acidocella aminolytica 101 = DSM 11237]SHE58276.1 Signal transduction histidine kinase [Acidocella aminolytica 101 = DSM 11237]
MAFPQRITPIRRSYNQFVADETMEDYALRFTASAARKFSARAVANTAFGATSFLALEAIGATVTLQYGPVNAVAAILSVALLISLTAGPIAYVAAKYGVDIDLLTRAAGFGYIGSTITSLIYASFTFIFFALEASIFANMLNQVFGIPLHLGYVLTTLGIIPLAAYGITFISRFQAWSQPLWLALNFLPLLFLALDPALLHDWAGFHGLGWAGGFSLLPFGACASIIVSLIAQIGEQADYLRFLPRPDPKARWRWWGALLAAGPGWVLPGVVKMLMGSVLGVLSLGLGYGAEQAAQPIILYHAAYGLALPPHAALLAAALLVAVAQTKINVTNAYAGSIAWSNFFSRLTHRHPGRVIWLVFNAAIGLLLMELDIYRSIAPILAFYSVLACGWIGAISADLVLVKGMRLGPRIIEFKRAHLYDINPVGTGAMLLATLAGALCISGLLGAYAHAFAPFIALASAFIAVPAIAAATRGRFYLARRPRRAWAGESQLVCSVCDNAFEPQDIAYCPAYAAPICSLCCTLDSRCRDACKPHARYGTQIIGLMRHLLPARLRGRMDPVLLRFLGVFSLTAVVLGVIFCAFYWQAASQNSALAALLATAFWRVFVCILLVAGVFAWLQVLARESSLAAEEESRRQTQLLLAEIDAHRKTDAKLARAREVAEAANIAKTRFIVGVSHELRTPLNAVLGYAQLLENDETIPPRRRETIGIIRRSGEHLHGLIEGLMDISKIEAGRIDIERREVNFPDFLAQITGMFRLQAAAKGLSFEFETPSRLPTLVFIDEIRLRQILINLLSNALKFTTRGGIRLALRIPGEVMEFEVADTGPGIAPQDLARIFEPFERALPKNSAAPPGIGLGLTITKLLVEILGGRISVDSTPGKGSRFRVQLLISRAPRASASAPMQGRIVGYQGARRTIIAAEDNAVHRALLQDALTPLGFTLLTAPDGPSCLRLAAGCKADLFLLDYSMPQTEMPALNGLGLARQLRRQPNHAATPVIMLTAHAPVLHGGGEAAYDAALPKPVNFAKLLETIGTLLKLAWIQDTPAPAEPTAPSAPGLAEAALRPHIAQLRYLAQIGFIRGLEESLERLALEAPEAKDILAPLSALAAGLRLPEFLAALEELEQDAA